MWRTQTWKAADGNVLYLCNYRQSDLQTMAEAVDRSLKINTSTEEDKHGRGPQISSCRDSGPKVLQLVAD